MSRLNPATLPRPALAEDEREYTDKKQPGASVTLKFRELDPCGKLEAAAKYREYARRWLKGKESGIFPLPGGPVTLSPILLDNIAMLEVMEVPPAGEQAYSLPDYLAFAKNMPSAFEQMILVCITLNVGTPGEEADEGNAPGAPGETATT